MCALLVHLGTGQDHKSRFVVIGRKNEAEVVGRCDLMWGAFVIYSVVFVAQRLV